jgi:uncharacterized membrane protein YhaH (DUF805 family)
MVSSNPYAPPHADVADVSGEEAFQPVKIWSAQGRVGRLRYLSYHGVAYLLLMVLGFAGGLVGALQQSTAPAIVLVGLGSVGYFVLTVLLTIQRCHDMDWTGWASLLTLIPLVGLLFWFGPGTPGPNRFGAPPPPNGTGVKVLAWAGVLTLVLVIVGVLAAISLPAYQNYLQRARAAQGR